MIKAMMILMAGTFILFAFLAASYQKKLMVIIIILLFLEGFFCIVFLRCSHCHKSIHLWGQKYCPSCGKELTDISR